MIRCFGKQRLLGLGCQVAAQLDLQQLQGFAFSFS
jgi:hypothetical protein